MALQRSNIMLEPKVKEMLKDVSNNTGESISKLVNKAAIQAFSNYSDKLKLQKLHQKVLKLRENSRQSGKVDYKELAHGEHQH
jgi:hypothetical protein